MPPKGSRAMARNSNDLKIAVLQEQLKQIEVGLAGVRQDTKEFREDMRKDFAELKTEVITRADKHEESDRQFHTDASARMDRHEQTDIQNFKHIDDRMALSETAQATAKAAQDAVSNYKKWQWGLIATAATSIMWNVLRMIEPFLHKLLGTQ